MPTLTFCEHQKLAQTYPTIDPGIASAVLWVFDQDERYGRRPNTGRETAIVAAARLPKQRLWDLAKAGPFSARRIAQAVLCYEVEPNGIKYLQERSAAQ